MEEGLDFSPVLRAALSLKRSIEKLERSYDLELVEIVDLDG